MANDTKKKIRYYYWFFTEFTKKNLKLLILSFALSFIFIVGFISLSPYLQTIFFNKKEVVGIVGKYDIKSLPEEITSKISNGLVYLNEKGEITPALASSWEILNSGLKYRITLKNNLVWSDGEPLRAKDISYSFKDVTIDASQGDNVIYFTLKKPLPIFLGYLRKPVIRYPLKGVAGLYKVNLMRTKYGKIELLSLTPNKKGLPVLEYKFFDNENQLVTAYKMGQITQMTVTKKAVADIFSSWKNTTVIKNIDYSKLLTLFFNVDSKYFEDKEFRKAVIMGIDQSVFKDEGEMALGPVPPVSAVYNNNLKADLFDMATAKKTIKKTLSDSKTSINFYTYYDYINYADSLVDNLKQLGLNVNLNFISYEKPASFDMLLAFWQVPLDVDQYFFWHSTQQQGNISNYKNVKVDKLLEDGRNSTNPAEQKKVFYDFQKAILDDPPAAFLFYPYVYTVKRK